MNLSKKIAVLGIYLTSTATVITTTDNADVTQALELASVVTSHSNAAARKIQNAYRKHHSQLGIQQQAKEKAYITFISSHIKGDQDGNLVFPTNHAKLLKLKELLQKLPENKILTILPLDLKNNAQSLSIGYISKELNEHLAAYHHNAASKIQDTFRKHRIEVKKEEPVKFIQNNLYLKSDNSIDYVNDSEEVKKQISNYLASLPESQKIVLKSRNGKQSKEFTAFDIFINL